MLSFDNLQKGHTYRLVNYGDKVVFQVMEKLNENDWVIKQRDTLEVYHLSDLTKFGKGVDYELVEV